MQPKSIPPNTVPSHTDLVLEQLPNGQHAWLRPERPRRFILPARYWLTDRGRRAIAEARLLDPSPIVGELELGKLNHGLTWTFAQPRDPEGTL